MVEFIPRPHYLETLREFRDKPFIKVITGMRRCGKSTLMMMFRQPKFPTLSYIIPRVR